jgi:hypothetical protein
MLLKIKLNTHSLIIKLIISNFDQQKTAAAAMRKRVVSHLFLQQ